ncbi:MAG: peptidoglycan DD-metalloendopeptidase family protein [Luminiphilus sp.]|nr:peptidoglycan DD-metalloendopeptidase family protein [Luminiphilus sp.]
MARVLAFRPLLRVSYLAACLLFSAHLSAQSSEPADQTAEQLAALKAEIDTIQSQLDAQEQTRDTLEETLREADIQIGVYDQQLHVLSRQHVAIQNQLVHLDTQRAQLKAAQRQRSDHIEDSIQQLWVLQQGGGLRVWLGNQNPGDVARHLAFFQTIIEDQRAILAEYEQGLSAIESNRDATAETEVKLAQQTDLVGETREKLAAQQALRQQALAEINTQLGNNQQRLAMLTRDQQRLNALLDELQSLSMRSPSPLIEPQPFPDTRGALPMPVSGTPTNRFGARRNADIRWRGWLIAAKEGEPIQAIHDGHVIYADWLRGQGLLLVLDHGDGWLSLYAHNRSLLRKVGDRINAGQTIARAGASGGSHTPGLYFEIRHQGKPVDPADWIRR